MIILDGLYDLSDVTLIACTCLISSLMVAVYISWNFGSHLNFCSIFITLAIARARLFGREGLLSFHMIPTSYLSWFLVVVCSKISKALFSSLDHSFGSNGDSVLQLSTSQNFSTKLVRVLVGNADNLLIDACLWWPLPPNKTHPSFVLMPIGSSGFPCLYSRCRWGQLLLLNPFRSAPIIKNILLLAVDNGRSWICGRRFFVRLNDTLKKGILRWSTTHMFDSFIGFRCEDENN